MAITNKVRARSRPASFSMTRRTYNSVGTLTSTLGPLISNTTYTTFPYSGNGCYGQNRCQTRDYYVDSAWRSVLASQGFLPARPLSHECNFVAGQNFDNTYRRVGFPLERAVLSGGYLNVPQRVETSFESKINVLDPLRAALTTDAKYKCLSQARDMRVNIPVALAEMGKTVRMIGDTVKTLHSAYRNFRKGNFGKAARDLGITKPTKTTANHWLAYQYGWRPLVSDAVGAATVVYDFLNDTPPRTTVRAKVKADPTKSAGTFGAHPLIVGYTEAISWERNAIATAGLLLEVEYTSAALAAQLGVGLTDPLLTAWELTPFSFVFDWFVDVGGWIEARSSLQGYRVKTGWEATRIDYNWSVKEVPGGTYMAPDNLVTWNGLCSHYKRSSWSGGVVSLRTPLLDGLKGNRVKSAAALAVQQCRGDRRKGAYRP